MNDGKIARAILRNSSRADAETPLIRAYRTLLRGTQYELADRLDGLDGLCFGCGYEHDRCKCTGG